MNVFGKRLIGMREGENKKMKSIDTIYMITGRAFNFFLCRGHPVVLEN